MKNINLSKGFVTKVDDRDFEEVSKYKWFASEVKPNMFYAKRVSYPQMYLHRFILNCPDGLQIDHINGDKLDNRRENLRIVNQSQNNFNNKKRKNATSIYKGVRKDKERNLWVAQCQLGGKSKFIGRFHDEKTAAMAYDFVALQLYGKYARTNFGVDKFNFVSGWQLDQ